MTISNFGRFEEPDIVVNNGKLAKDPKTGLLYEGPHDSELGPESIKVGIVGSKKTIELTREFLKDCKKGIESDSDEISAKPPFPPFKSSEKWSCELKIDQRWTQLITKREIESVMSEDKIEEGIGKSSHLIENKLNRLNDKQNSPDVIIVATPEKINQKFGVGADVKGRKYLEGREELKDVEQSKQSDLSSFNDNLDSPKRAWNLRRSLKIASMDLGTPIQLINKSTLSNSNQRARKAWYLMSALYYKAGGVPWRGTQRDPNTCYIGFSFYRELKKDKEFRTSLAQLFTPGGESIVLRGDRAVEDDEKNLHLSEESMEELVSSALEKYKKHIGSTPRRLVIHKKGPFTEEEVEGAHSVSEDIRLLDLVGVSPSDLKLYRSGKYPVPRGTYMTQESETHLYLTGYIPEIGTYPGNGVPRPVKLQLKHSESSYQKICQELLQLSKMSWNNAGIATRRPVTIEFTDKVGEILSEMIEPESIESDFRFYM